MTCHLEDLLSAKTVRHHDFVSIGFHVERCRRMNNGGTASNVIHELRSRIRRTNINLNIGKSTRCSQRMPTYPNDLPSNLYELVGNSPAY